MDGNAIMLQCPVDTCTAIGLKVPQLIFRILCIVQLMILQLRASCTHGSEIHEHHLDRLHSAEPWGFDLHHHTITAVNKDSIAQYAALSSADKLF